MPKDLEMISRPKPSPVPQDWYDVKLWPLLERLDEISAPFYENATSIEAGDAMNKVPVPLYKEDVYLYFETVLIASDDVIDAFRNYTTHPPLGPTEKLPNLDWGKMMINFGKWWVLSHFEVNRGGLYTMRTEYFLATNPAFREYFKTGNVSKAYALMDEKMSERRRDFEDGGSL